MKLRGSWVLQYETRPRAALRPPPPLAVASLNTHDMPPFEGWVRGDDLATRRSLGFLAADAEPRERARRQQLLSALRRLVSVAGNNQSESALLEACLTYLGRSPAGLVLVSLADLLGECEPENHPGTTTEHPNWRRRQSLSLEAAALSPAVLRLVDALRAARTAEQARPLVRPAVPSPEARRAPSSPG